MLKYTTIFASLMLCSLAVAQNAESIQSQIDEAIQKTQVLQSKLDETVTLAEEIRQTLAAINTGSDMAFQVREGFEANDLGDWQLSDPVNSTFTVIGTEQRTGSYCVRAGTAIGGDNDVMFLELGMTAEGTLTFYVKGDAYAEVKIFLYNEVTDSLSEVWVGAGASIGGTPDLVLTSSYQLATVTIPVTTSIIQIQENYNASGSTFYIDDIQITNVDGLTVEQEVTASSISPTHGYMVSGSGQAYTGTYGHVGIGGPNLAYIWWVFETGRLTTDTIQRAKINYWAARSYTGTGNFLWFTKLIATANPPTSGADFQTKLATDRSVGTVATAFANNSGVVTFNAQTGLEDIINEIPADEPTWDGDVELWVRNNGMAGTDNNVRIETAESAGKEPVLVLEYYPELTHSADAGTFDTEELTLTGTHDTFDDIAVSFNGTEYTSADEELVDDGDGTWTLTVPAPTTPDDYELNVRVGSLYAAPATITSQYEAPAVSSSQLNRRFAP